jgi:hypothetical protein
MGSKSYLNHILESLLRNTDLQLNLKRETHWNNMKRLKININFD